MNETKAEKALTCPNLDILLDQEIKDYNEHRFDNFNFSSIVDEYK